MSTTEVQPAIVPVETTPVADKPPAVVTQDVATSAVKPIAVYGPTANPGPLGLCAFALTTLVLSLYNAGAGVAIEGPNTVVVGLAVFYGGIVQLLAGMWEFRTGNTFGATAFSSYGGFWLSFATIFIPGYNIIPPYTATAANGSDKFPESELTNALGIYLFAWTLFTLIMLIASHKTSIAIMSLFFFLFVTFLLLTVAKFVSSDSTQVAGGAFGIITALIAFYAALAQLLTPETSYFQLPTYPLNKIV